MSYDGDVMVCPMDWGKTHVVGNINNDSLMNIWHSEGYHEVRRRLMVQDRSCKPCRKCDVDGTLYAEGHFNAWKSYYGKEPHTQEVRAEAT